MAGKLCPGGGRLPVTPLPLPIATTQEALVVGAGGGAARRGQEGVAEVHFALSGGLPAGQLLHPRGKAPNTYLTDFVRFLGRFYPSNGIYL